MEELLPFIFFVVWLLIGGLGGKKKREEAQRRAEAERAAREAQARARQAAREARDSEGRISASSPPAPQPTMQQPTGTAADMVPDELWAILTGGAPRPTGPPTPIPQRAPEPEPVEYDWQPAGPDEGGWVTAPPWDEEDAVDSIEGVSAERGGENTVDYDDQAERIARARYENVSETSWGEGLASSDALALRTPETSERRHYEFHDSLRASEIGGVGQVERPSTAAFLGLSDLGDVRRAIVLMEILGKPKSLEY